jgi:hypothetical protein
MARATWTDKKAQKLPEMSPDERRDCEPVTPRLGRSSRLASAGSSNRGRRRRHVYAALRYHQLLGMRSQDHWTIGAPFAVLAPSTFRHRWLFSFTM